MAFIPSSLKCPSQVPHSLIPIATMHLKLCHMVLMPNTHIKIQVDRRQVLGAWSLHYQAEFQGIQKDYSSENVRKYREVLNPKSTFPYIYS